MFEVNQRLGWTYRLHLHGWLISHKRNQHEASSMFLRNIGWLLTEYAALYPRK
jgi:hypothetical protein